MGTRLKDTVAIVSGAGCVGPGWGNGKAAAVLFAREGAAVFCVDIRREAAEETCDPILGKGGRAEAWECDVSRSDQVEAMVEGCLAKHGRIDVLQNNVGALAMGGPVETGEADWDRVHNVNLKSIFLTCKYVLPVMERQGAEPLSTSPRSQGYVTSASAISPITPRRRR